MLGIQSAWREGSDFSPAEAVYCAQPIPGHRRGSIAFTPVSDLQGILTGRTLLPTTHHSTLAPIELPEDLLLAKHVLVRRDGHVLPLAVAYVGPLLVLEYSLFKLQVVYRLDTVSTLRLKPCTSPPDVPVALPPRRGRPPATAEWTTPDVPPPPDRGASPQRSHCSRVSFRCPVVFQPPPPTQRLNPSGRPAHFAGLPRRYMVSSVHLRCPRLGGELWRDDI
jgi:hypothetical protein